MSKLLKSKVLAMVVMMLIVLIGGSTEAHAAEMMGRDNVDFMLGAYSADSATEYSADLVSRVVFAKRAPNNYIDSWDVSASADGSVMSYIVPSFIENGVQFYDQYFVASSAINATVCEKLFSGYSNMTEISNFEFFTTTGAESMAYMFNDCASLEYLDVSGLNSSAVTDMYYIFAGCSSLTSLDLDEFDVSSVSDFRYMFADCSSLTALDLSSFDTASAENMGYMFYGCSNLTSLDLTGFDTSNVTYMHYMFANCSSLRFLDLYDFDTVNVRNMLRMFDNCSNLYFLGIDNFDTSNVTNMSNMFYNVTRLNVIVFGEDFAFVGSSHYFDDTEFFGVGGSWIKDGEGDEYTATELSALSGTDLAGFWERVIQPFELMVREDSEYMLGAYRAERTEYTADLVSKVIFGTKLPETYVASWDVSANLDGSIMSYIMRSEVINGVQYYDQYIVAENEVTASSYENLFKDYSNATEIQNLDFILTNNATNMNSMFAGCRSLTKLDVSEFNTSNVLSMQSMFKGCESLTELELAGFDTAKVVSLSSMFEGCESLKTLTLGLGFDKINGANMFAGCDSLTRVISLRDAVMTVSSDNALGELVSRVLYVPYTSVETRYEANSTYTSLLGADRIKPFLGVAGSQTVTVGVNGNYVDAGATVAGYEEKDSAIYKAWGYEVQTTGLPVNTSTTGTKTVTYKFMQSGWVLDTVTRTVNVADLTLMGRDYRGYMLGAHRANSATTYTANLVTKVIFTDEAPQNAKDSWDVSYTNGDKAIMSYIVPSKYENGVQYYDQYIVATGMISLSSGYSLFLRLYKYDSNREYGICIDK